MLNGKESVWSAVIFIYFLCYAFRAWEYFILRTDKTFWNEAFVHKLAGIVILFIAVSHYNLPFAELGFPKKEAFHSLLFGLGFGLLVFVPVYLVEIIIALMQGRFQTLALYVSAYSINGTTDSQTGFLFFAICIAGNTINVIMEEGIFRGFFQNLLEKKYPFMLSAVIASCLFGLWHMIAPVRSYYDKTISCKGFLANAALLAITSGLAGFQYALLTKLTGSLYMAMGHHFINNTIVNMLHVVSGTGTDNLMTARIAIAQTLSFVIISAWYALYML